MSGFIESVRDRDARYIHWGWLPCLPDYRNVYFLNIIFNSVEEGQGHSTAEILIKQIVISQAVVKLTVLYACLR